jgi:hypothetical protein
MDRSPLLLAAVLGVHLWVSAALARAWLRRADERFWGMVLATLAQWGTLATVLSLAHALTPAGWLAGLAVLALAAVLALRLHAPSADERAERAAARRIAVAPRGALLLALLVAALFAVQWHTPLHKGDDLMYHASRVAYWLEHRSLLPFPTHNDRQNVFPTAGDLPFLVGLLFTRDERIARVLHLAALPLALWGIVRLERALGVRGTRALVGPLLFLTTPLVVAAAEGIGAELWTAVALLGFVHGLVAVTHGAERRGGLGRFGLGAFAALGVAVKLTLLPLLALLPAAALVARPGAPPWPRRLGALAAGLVAGTLASGLALTLAANAVAYGHPLGPAEMRRVHRRDPGLATLSVHAARVPFLLAGVPVLWSEPARQALEEGAARLADALGATRPLAGEGVPGWPGTFRVRVPRVDARLSATALLAVGAVLWALVHAARRRRRGRGVSRWAPLWVAAAIGLPLAAIVTGLRWQPAAGLPDRFVVPLLAPASALVALAAGAIARGRVAASALGLLLLWCVLPGTLLLGQRLAVVAREPARAPGRVGLFADAAAALPAGARVLLVSGQSSGDYVLFAPERGLANVVVPWGQRPFDEAELAAVLARHRPTHVLVESADAVDLHWGGRLDTRALVAAVAALPGARRVPLPDRDMRLFALP